MFKKSAKTFASALGLVLAGTSQIMNAKEMTEFDWLATESAPIDYPMQIIKGSSYFRYHGSENDGLYIPSGGILYQGWGTPISTHVVGPDRKPLPDRLDITYFSYLEDTFYQGRFDLPYEKILSLFREGAAIDKGNPIYRKVMVGVAPGGNIAVWVTGRKTTEVFFGKAQKANINWGKAIDYPEAERKEFVREVVVDSVKPETLAKIEKNGIPFDQWANYRTQYNWIPTIVGSEQPKSTRIIYFNGEYGDVDLPFTDEFRKTTRPVPSDIWFNARLPGGTKNYVFDFIFDEHEIITAFEKLGKHQSPLKLEFAPAIPKLDTKIRLYNDKESIYLTKWRLRD